MVAEPGVNVVVRDAKDEGGVAQGYARGTRLIAGELACDQAVPVVQVKVNVLYVIVLKGESLGLDGCVHYAFLVYVQVYCGTFRNVQAWHHKAQQVKAVIYVHIYLVFVSLPVRNRLLALEQHRKGLEGGDVHKRLGELQYGPVGYVGCVRKV